MKRSITTALLALLAAAMVTGCASQQDNYYGAIKATLEASSRENVARYEAERAKVAAIAQIAATGGDVAKTAAVFALAFNQASSPATTAAAVPQIQPPRSTGENLWLTFLQVADIGLRGWGIKVGGDVAIRQSEAQARTTIAGYQAFTGMASAGFNSNAAIASYIQAPAPNITNTLSGTGVLGSGTYTGPITRTCTGGQAGNGAGTATGGAGGPGGGATC